MRNDPRTVNAVDMADYMVDNGDAFRNLQANLMHSKQHVDVPTKSDDERFVTNTLEPSFSDEVTNSNATYAYADAVTPNDTISYMIKNESCVGEPDYCNMTESEYRQMVYDYIFPSHGEWVLIGCHGIVFLVGLVSFSISINKIC